MNINEDIQNGANALFQMTHAIRQGDTGFLRQEATKLRAAVRDHAPLPGTHPFCKGLALLQLLSSSLGEPSSLTLSGHILAIKGPDVWEARALNILALVPTAMEVESSH